ncbi:MAG TPA: hypothetical protein VFH64_01920 [Amnibacterium sp.]|nr:hypothetical protein [Amnibacterium sp.]
MNLTTVADLVLGIGVIVLICVRQLSWTAVRPSRMWRLPLVLGVIGVFSLLRGSPRALSGADVALLLVEAVVALGTGALMGRITVFRPIAAAPASLRPGEPAPSLECRTGWTGVALWAVLIAARIGVAVVGHRFGAVAVESTGVVLLVIALNRVARVAVVLARTGGAPALARR